jgi:hypothetical protein
MREQVYRHSSCQLTTKNLLKMAIYGINKLPSELLFSIFVLLTASDPTCMLLDWKVTILCFGV